MKSILLVLAVFVYLPFAFSQNPGDPDPSFGGGNGYVIPQIPEPDGTVSTTMIVQPDGKIVAVAGGEDIWILRFNADGSPDQTFGQNGITTFNISGIYFSYMLALTTDGKILVSGGIVSYPYDFFVARLLANGSLDTNFGNAGIIKMEVYPNASFSSQPVMASDPVSGLIYIAGQFDEFNFPYAKGYSIVSFNPDGSLNTNFSGDGKAIYSFPGNPDSDLNVWALQVTSEGKLLLGGSYLLVPGNSENSQVLVTRINQNGDIDNTFGTNGMTIIGPEDKDLLVSNLAIQPNGHIIVLTEMFENAGIGVNAGYKVYGFLPDGLLDSGFGQNGETNLLHSGPTEDFTVDGGLAIQPDGKIVVAGGDIDVFSYYATIRVSRLNADGNPDMGFGSAGTRLFELPDFSSVATDVSIQPDTKIVTCGTAHNFNNFIQKFILNRFNAGPVSTVSEFPSIIHEAEVYPNPVQFAKTNLSFSLSEPCTLQIGILAPDGKELAKLTTPQKLTSGRHQISLQLPSDLNPGNYWIRMEGDGGQKVLRVIVGR